jgi:hypothetical protein
VSYDKRTAQSGIPPASNFATHPGILADGKKALLHLAPGSKEDTASCREFFHDLRRRGLPGSAAGGERRGAWSHPRDRGVLPALGPPALSRAQDAQPAEQGA